ncbi:MAG: POTRA domain-containing protein, partial [Aquabacterium sp.]
MSLAGPEPRSSRAPPAAVPRIAGGGASRPVFTSRQRLFAKNSCPSRGAERPPSAPGARREDDDPAAPDPAVALAVPVPSALCPHRASGGSLADDFARAADAADTGPARSRRGGPPTRAAKAHRPRTHPRQVRSRPTLIVRTSSSPPVLVWCARCGAQVRVRSCSSRSRSSDATAFPKGEARSRTSRSRVCTTSTTRSSKAKSSRARARSSSGSSTASSTTTRYFDRFALRRDLARIERWLRARGYYEAKVHVARVVTRGDKVDVTVEVEQGEPVVGLGIRHRRRRRPRRRREETPPERVRGLPNGSPLDEDKLLDAEKAGEKVLTARGYAAAKCARRAEVDLMTQTARVVLTFEPGAVARFGSVTFEGLGELPEDRVRRISASPKGSSTRATISMTASRRSSIWASSRPSSLSPICARREETKVVPIKVRTEDGEAPRDRDRRRSRVRLAEDRRPRSHRLEELEL